MRESNAKQRSRSSQQDPIRHGRRLTILALVVVMHLPTLFAAAHGQTNSAPVVLLSIDDVTLTVGYGATQFDLATHFNDPDGDSLSYGVWHSNNVGVLFSGSTMSLTGRAAGMSTVTVRATDPSDLYAELSFAATVRANTAPVVLLPIPDATLTVGGRTGTVVLSSHFQDAEEGDLTYAATSADPAIATATVAEGVLSVTAVAAGATTVTVTASDPAAATSAPDVFAVTVGSPVSVTVPDANLRTAVEAALARQAGATINSAEMEGLGRLECDSCGIQNLTGLEFATGLTALALGGNSITDPTPLSGLTGLTDLDLGSNSLTDVSPLSGLTGLTDLDLGSNSLTDVSPLSGLTGLTDLDLGSNSLTDVSPLSGLTGLTDLDLGSNSLTDVSPLSGLTGLTDLDLGSNSLTDVSPLSGLTGLTDLDLGSNSLTDVTPLSGLTGLTDLDLGGNSLTDVSPLSGLTGLTDLDLASNSLTDASPLSGLTALTDVELDGNSLTDISPLSSLTSLSRLYLRHNCLTGIHALTSNTGLGQGDHIALEWNPLVASAVAGDLAALRGRGVTVLVSETASVEVVAPLNVSATPGDGELTLTWDSPRDPDDVTVYEVRWRSATGTFSAWTIVPCSSKRRHKLTGLDNGTAYTVELRAAGHADNGVATVGPTTVRPPNRAPVVSLSIPDVSLTVGYGATQFDLSNHFSDPDGDELLFTASPPTIVTATVTGNTMTVAPVAAGTGVATVRAADPSGLFVEQTFNVTVGANGAPEVSLAIDNMTLTVGGRSETVTLSAHFRDPEQGALTYSSVSASPAVATATVSDGVLTVSGVSVGTARMTVTASDQGGATSAGAVFTVTARAAVNVEIPDANLRTAVEQELGKQAGATITSAEMEQIVSFMCQDCNIEVLSGLEYATGMTDLDLGDNVSIADLAALSGLTNLTLIR